MAYKKPGAGANKAQIILASPLAVGFIFMGLVPSRMPEEARLPVLVIGIIIVAFIIFNYVELKKN